MINVNLLKAEVVKNGITHEELCKRIEMAHSTYIRKMRKGVFNTDEVEKIVDVLNIQNPIEIFFAKELT